MNNDSRNTDVAMGLERLETSVLLVLHRAGSVLEISEIHDQLGIRQLTRKADDVKHDNLIWSILVRLECAAYTKCVKRGEKREEWQITDEGVSRIEGQCVLPREGFTINENARNAFAADGLEILKRSVLLVLYEGTEIAYEGSPYPQDAFSQLGQFVNGLAYCDRESLVVALTLYFMAFWIIYNITDMHIIIVVRDGRLLRKVYRSLRIDFDLLSSHSLTDFDDETLQSELTR